jgi:hypothetical protein
MGEVAGDGAGGDFNVDGGDIGGAGGEYFVRKFPRPPFETARALGPFKLTRGFDWPGEIVTLLRTSRLRILLRVPQGTGYQTLAARWATVIDLLWCGPANRWIPAPLGCSTAGGGQGCPRYVTLAYATGSVAATL